VLRIGCIGLSLITEHITPPLAAARYGTKSSVQPCFPFSRPAVGRGTGILGPSSKPAQQRIRWTGGVRPTNGFTSEETFLHGWALPHWAELAGRAHPTGLQLGSFRGYLVYMD
jgi:hypothetical protein